MRSQRTTLIPRLAMVRRCVLTWAVGTAALTALWAAGAPAAVMVAATGALSILAAVVR